MTNEIFRSLLWFCTPGALAIVGAASAQPNPPVLACNDGHVACVNEDINVPYDLGDIPARFRAVEFADIPATHRTVTVNSNTDLSRELEVNGSRLVVGAGTYNGTAIRGTDIDLVLSNSATFTGGLQILGTRVRVTGGTVASIHGLDTANHFTLDNVRVREGLYFHPWNGNTPHHISILRSTIESPGNEYPILIGEGGINHFILAGSDISNGADAYAAIRIMSSEYVILADNRVFSSGNRILRTHDTSNLHLWIRNQFETDDIHNLWLGPFVGGATGGRMNSIEILDNTYYGPVAGISGFPLQIDGDQGAGIADVTIRNNRFFTPGDGTRVTSGYAEPPFVVENNTFAPYQTPPPSSAGADH